MVVPLRPDSSYELIIFPFSIESTFRKLSKSEDDILNFDTEQILEIASPLNPLVVNLNKSSWLDILDVVCFK